VEADLVAEELTLSVRRPYGRSAFNMVAVGDGLNESR